ncbi:FAD-dependent oxidoreductase [Campylobacter helveticus]|uniref:FAD-dependent oxidoreductase n=2 Tax=Campylobacter helveticus TaxID=28898 RepID=UPI0009D8D15D|nr:FAD-dependent oxidoreductase [Campylobacter helveticus]SMC23196.1 NAD(P)-binding Rossmann-like domain-containing protein [Campylobacter helveticus]SUW82519.1 UDP-galactopyranose mutase [Campylobacter helveticus]
MYDYLIVGAGLFGSIFAYEASKRGKKCLVLERREHTGGNCYTKEMAEKNVHFCGRLGEYRYYDMQDVVKSALKFCESELGK